MFPYEAIVFDFDGVLADSVSVKTRAFEKLYAQYGKAVSDKVVQYHVDNGGMPRAEKFVFYERELLGRIATPERLARLNDEFSALVVNDVVAAPEIPGASAFLRSLHSRVPLFIDSASPDCELGPILERRGISSFFDGVYGSDKSKKKNLETILSKGQYSPGKVLFFGDASSDLAAAQACGTDFFGIGGDTSPLADLVPVSRIFVDFIQVQAFFDEGLK